MVCCVVGAVLGLASPAASSNAAEPINGAGQAALDAATAEAFELRIRPLLSSRCWECHGKELAESDLRLDSRARLLRGGKRGPAIDEKQPQASLLLQAIHHTDPDLKMPPDGQLSAEDAAAMTAWVMAGAPWPESASEKTVASDHWAFQPVRKPAVPTAVDSTWCLNAIDHFVAAGQRAHGLNASARADRRTLIRRVSFDLTGLPPTAAEVATFLADRRPEPEALRQVIENYLTSPRYGERWGRHWLDIARFADTAGYRSVELDYNRADRPDAFTYRDWVIEALNRDEPYGSFICLQLAADLLPEGRDDLRMQRALGFLTVGRRDKRDVHEIMDDRIDTVTRGLLGLTVHCARCHDHKTDPIPTDDYYSLYGVFCSVEEPQPFPLLSVEDTPSGRDFQKQLQPLQSAVDAFLAKKADDYARESRARLPELMAALAEAESSGQPNSLQPVAYRRKLPVRLVTSFVGRWRRAASDSASARLFYPWNAWKELPRDGFAAARSALLKRVSAAAGECDPAIAAAVTADQPADLGAVAAGYARVLQQSLGSGHPVRGGSEAWSVFLRSPQSPLVCPHNEVAETLDHEGLKQLAALEGPVNQLYATHPGAPGRAMVVRERQTPYEAKVFVRGQAESAGPPAPRRFLTLFNDSSAEDYRTGSGRLAMARTIVDPNNPLTARVLVNYVWLKHFGRGLVATANNFGLSGVAPSNPELLDYLAAEFWEQGGSLKQLHRLMLNSAAYAQASANRSPCLALDPSNVWLWKFNSRPLDFECLRDAALFVSGELDASLGGRSVPLEQCAASTRRTMYLFADRMRFDPVRRLFNVPVPKATAPERYQNIVPQQALYLMNNSFVMDRAESLTRLPEFRALHDREQRIAWLFERLLSRPPEAEERRLAAAFLSQELAEPAGDEARAWARLAHGLLMTSEFAFVE